MTYLNSYPSASTFDSMEGTVHVMNLIPKSEACQYSDGQGEPSGPYFPAQKVTIEKGVSTGTHSGKTYIEVDWSQYNRLTYGWSPNFELDLINPDTMVGLCSRYNIGTGEMTYGHVFDIFVDWERPTDMLVHFYSNGTSSYQRGTGYPICGDTNGNEYVFVQPYIAYNGVGSQPDPAYMYNAVLCYIPMMAPNPNAKGDMVLGSSNNMVYVYTRNETVMVCDKLISLDIPIVSSVTPGVGYICDNEKVVYNFPPIDVITRTYEDVYNPETGSDERVEIPISKKKFTRLDIPFSAIVEDAVTYLNGIDPGQNDKVIYIACGQYGKSIYLNNVSDEQTLADSFWFFYDFINHALIPEYIYGKNIIVEPRLEGRPK